MTTFCYLLRGQCNETAREARCPLRERQEGLLTAHMATAMAQDHMLGTATVVASSGKESITNSRDESLDEVGRATDDRLEILDDSETLRIGEAVALLRIRVD